MVHVPYGDPAKVIAAVISGDVHMFIETVGSIGPQVKAGKMRLLAVAANKRSPFAPDVPTVAETGLPAFESGSWSGLLAPAGTPREIVNKVQAETARILVLPEVKARLAADGADAVGNRPEEFAAYIRTEIAKWGKVVKAGGIKLE